MTAFFEIEPLPFFLAGCAGLGTMPSGSPMNLEPSRTEALPEARTRARCGGIRTKTKADGNR